MNLRFIKKSPFDFAPLPISPYLVTQNDWNVFAVPELRSIFHEKRISREDGHSSQDERGKQIGSGCNYVCNGASCNITKATLKL